MIGSHVPRLFATKGYNIVALFSRNPANLSRDANFITSAAPSAQIHTYATDVTNDTSFPSTLKKAVSDLGTPQVVIYNTARIAYGTFGDYPHSDVRKDFEIANIGLIHTAEVLLPLLKENQNGYEKVAFYVTSGAIIHQPMMPVYSLCMAKSAQASLTKVLAEEYKGLVHVALVTVGGVVTPQEEVNNPTHIATKFWELWEQTENWEFEMKCGW